MVAASVFLFVFSVYLQKVDPPVCVEPRWYRAPPSHICASDLIHSLVEPADREENWAGLSLPSGETLSANELNDHFTEKSSSRTAWLTRLMVLCACSSGRHVRARLHRGNIIIV